MSPGTTLQQIVGGARLTKVIGLVGLDGVDIVHSARARGHGCWGMSQLGD